MSSGERFLSALLVGVILAFSITIKSHLAIATDQREALEERVSLLEKRVDRLSNKLLISFGNRRMKEQEI